MIHTHTTSTAFFHAAQAVVSAAPLEFPPAAPVPSFIAPAAAGPVRRDGPAGRFYDIPGDPVPYVSVTHALTCLHKPALVPWAADQERAMVLEAVRAFHADTLKVKGLPPLPTSGFMATLMARLPTQRAHQRKLEREGDIGTQVHARIAWECHQELGQAVGAAPTFTHVEAQRAFEGFQAWRREVRLKVKHVDQIVFSRTHQYAGTDDVLVEINGRDFVIDFKTGKAIYPEAYLQSVAYQQALEEMGHGPIAGGLIIRLPKRVGDPSFEVGHVPACATLYPSFLAVLQVWAWWYAAEQAGKAARRSAAIAARSSAA